jgi:protein-disulfide isomerase
VKNRNMLIVVATGVAILAGLLILAAGSRPSNVGKDSTSNSSANGGDEYGLGIDLSRRTAGDPLALGRKDAPVVLIEYADFRCPFCGVFARETKPQLAKYVDDGTLRIEWRDLPVFGDESVQAALAGRAAAEQGKFWEFYEVVFAKAPQRGHASLTTNVLLKFAMEAGVPDPIKFKADMKSPELARSIEADTAEATELGATGTPLFLVDDEPIVGAQPLSVFIEKIERLAKK